MASRDAVKLVKVSKVYKMGRVYVVGLRNVSISFAKGEFTSVVGPSGSGKTTMMNLIGGLDRPTTGHIYIDGVDTVYLSDDELTVLRRTKIGFIFQFFNLIPTLNAMENVMLPMALAGRYSREERKRRALMLLRLVGLGHRAKHKPDQMSGGERQRVAIARALANNPTIVLADEPTGNLDSKTGRSVVELMQKLNRERGVTFIIVTHDMEVADMTRRIVQVRDGRIVSDDHRR